MLESTGVFTGRKEKKKKKEYGEILVNHRTQIDLVQNVELAYFSNKLDGIGTEKESSVPRKTNHPQNCNAASHPVNSCQSFDISSDFFLSL